MSPGRRAHAVRRARVPLRQHTLPDSQCVACDACAGASVSLPARCSQHANAMRTIYRGAVLGGGGGLTGFMSLQVAAALRKRQSINVEHVRGLRAKTVTIFDSRSFTHRLANGLTCWADGARWNPQRQIQNRYCGSRLEIRER